MTTGTFFLDYRYLLLYFMPLSEEQLNHYINQLPPRHRDALLQPGLGRMVPDIMDNFMRLDIDSSSDAVHADTSDERVPLMLENGEDASVSSGLTNIDETEGASVSLFDVIVGLGSTLTIAASNNSNAPLPAIAEERNPAPSGEAALAENSNNIAIADATAEHDDSGSSFDFSIDIDTSGLPDVGVETPAASGIAETHDSQQNNNRNRRDQAQADQTARDEYDLEGRILTEAATTVVSNIGTQASSAAADGAMEVVQAASGWVVNAGTITGLLAGGGGIVAAVIARQPVVLGALGGASTTSSTAAQASTNGGADESSGPSPHRASSQWMQGLFATSAVGFASAGLAYFVRSRVRATIAAKREKRQVEDEKKPSR